MTRRPGITRTQDGHAAAIRALKVWCQANGGQVALAKAARVSEAFVSQTLSGVHPSIPDSLLSVIGWSSRLVYVGPTVTLEELKHA